jgi:hypothetical protein
VADRIYAAIEAVEVATSGEAADVVAGEAELQELPMGHHPVLLGGQGGKPPLTWSILMVPTPPTIVHVRHAPDVDTKPVTRG